MQTRRCRSWPLVLAVAAVTVMVLGCGSRPPSPSAVPEERAATPPPPPVEPSAERQGATADELESVPPPPAVGPDAEGWADASPPPPAAREPAVRTTYGYRVQVFAGGTRERAEQVAAEAGGRLAEPVHVEYEAPFYKVRVGNCVTRHEAERLKDRAIELGYDGAFITETTVELER